MKKFMQFICLLLLAAFPLATYSKCFDQVQTLFPTIPGDTGQTGVGDGFGEVLFVNNEFLVVGAPVAQPNNQFASGAVYVYKKRHDHWKKIQTITTDGLLDQTSAFNVLIQGEWLLIAGIGTTLGATTVAQKDFTGSLLIYRFSEKCEKWIFHQSINRTTPGLENLTVVNPSALAFFPETPTPVFTTEQGAAFGVSFALHPDNKLLLVGAFTQANVDPLTGETLINSGAVFAFKLIHGQWVLTQQFTNPDGVSANDVFGSSLVTYKDFALISNANRGFLPHVDINSKVYVFRYTKGQWKFIQKINGDQTNTTPVILPAFTGNNNPRGIGDNFGASIAVDDGWAVIGAPFENLGTDQIKGAAYFFKFEKVGSETKLVQKQKVVSDDPTSLIFGVSTAIDGKTALVGDPVHTGPNGERAQGTLAVFRLRCASGKENKKQHAKWIKKANLFDNAGFAFESMGNGVAVKDNLIIGASGNASEALFFNFDTIGLPLTFPLPVPKSRAVVWKQRKSI